VADPLVVENRHHQRIPERATRGKTAADLSPGQQARVAAGGSRVDRGHPPGGEADHVVWAASLGPGARKPLAAERLASNDRADLVAVDIDVADAGPAFDQVTGGIDTAMETERQAVASAVDVFDHAVEA